MDSAHSNLKHLFVHISANVYTYFLTMMNEKDDSYMKISVFRIIIKHYVLGYSINYYISAL